MGAVSIRALRINLHRPRSRWAKYRRGQARSRAQATRALRTTLYAFLTIGYAAWVRLGRPAEVALTGVPACALCGRQSRLSVDHVDGRRWSVAALAWKARLENYIAEFKAGIRLRLLCIKCNGRDGGRRAAVARMREPGEEG